MGTTNSRNSSTRAQTGLLEQATPIRQLDWDDSNHWKVLTQIHGSVWPNVTLFCLANTVITWIVYTLKTHYGIDLTSDSSGHKYMGFLMSFLVVTRAKITYDHYMANSNYLNQCYLHCRELTQQACVLTMSDRSERAKVWRQDICYAAIMLLRATVAVLKVRSSNEERTHPTLNGIGHNNPNGIGHNPNGIDPESCAAANTAGSSEEAPRPLVIVPEKLAHVNMHERVAIEEATRMPDLLAFHLRRQVLKVRDGTWLRKGTFRHPCNEELRLLEAVDKYMVAYAGLRKLLVTRFPFPLVQLAKTFLFLWVFSISFTLCHDHYREPYLVMVMVFLITYGYFGLELVSRELDDCFGDDPSDFDALGHARHCFEDCYIAVYKLDGANWAQKLQDRVRLGLFSEAVAQQSFFDACRWNGQEGSYMTPSNSTASLSDLSA